MEAEAESAVLPFVASPLGSPLGESPQTVASGVEGFTDGEDTNGLQELANPGKPAKGAGGGEDELDFELDDDGEIEEGEAESDKEEKVEDDIPKEVEVVIKKEDDEDGELNSEDELEEGEVKEDDEDEPTPEAEQKDKQGKSVCRFFGAGKCTWGESCRFYHEMPEQRGKEQQMICNMETKNNLYFRTSKEQSYATGFTQFWPWRKKSASPASSATAKRA